MAATCEGAGITKPHLTAGPAQRLALLEFDHHHRDVIHNTILLLHPPVVGRIHQLHKGGSSACGLVGRPEGLRLIRQAVHLGLAWALLLTAGGIQLAAAGKPCQLLKHCCAPQPRHSVCPHANAVAMRAEHSARGRMGAA